MPAFYEVLISARDEASGVFQKVANEAEKAARRAAKAAEPRGGLAGIKDVLGEGSMFGLGAKTLVGGGALAGASIATNAFGNFAETIRDVTRSYRSGEKSMEEVTQELLNGIPVIGGLFRGAKALADVITESTATFQAFAAQQKLRAAEEAERARLRSQNEQRDAIAGALADFDRGLINPETAADKRIAQFDAEMRQLDEFEKRSKAVDPTGGGEIMQRRIDAETRLAADLAKIEAEQQAEREKAYLEHTERIADINAQAREQELRNSGDVFEAERQQLQRQAEAEKAAAEERSAARAAGLEAQGLDTTSESLRHVAELAAIEKRLQAALAAVEQQRQQTESGRIDSSLDKFFGPIDAEADLFEVDRPRSRGPRRFASGTESRGTGAGALARSGQDPTLDAIKTGNEKLDGVREGIDALTKLAGRFFSNFPNLLGDGYSGSNS